MTTLAEVNETFSRLEAAALRIKEQRYDAVRLLEEIRRYADHRQDCIWKRHLGTPVCDCGYNSIEDRIAHLLAEITA